MANKIKRWNCAHCGHGNTTPYRCKRCSFRRGIDDQHSGFNCDPGFRYLSRDYAGADASAVSADHHRSSEPDRSSLDSTSPWIVVGLRPCQPAVNEVLDSASHGDDRLASFHNMAFVEVPVIDKKKLSPVIVVPPKLRIPSDHFYFKQNGLIYTVQGHPAAIEALKQIFANYNELIKDEMGGG